MMIISTGPITRPKKPNIAIPAKTASSISAASRRAALGTRIGRSTLSMLVTTRMWNATMKMPPMVLPKNIIPMPNGMVTMPPPSGITDSAVNRIANTKNPLWNPAM